MAYLAHCFEISVIASQKQKLRCFVILNRSQDTLGTIHNLSEEGANVAVMDLGLKKGGDLGLVI